MNNNFKRILSESGLKVNTTITAEQLTKYSQSIVKECAELLEAHAQNMEKYNFTKKSETIHSCSGIILEHFGIDKHKI